MRKWFPLILALALCFVCTAAMAECDHDMKFVANDDGTHSFACVLCGEIGYTEDCADSCDDSDEACDWCRSTSGEANNYHFDDPTCTVVDGKHVVTCGCGVVVGTYDPKPYPYDEYGHAMWCSYCLGSDGEMQSHTGTGVDNGDGTCSYYCPDCGFEHEGQHPAGGLLSGDGFHGVFCHLCETWLEKEACYEECGATDGECDYCGDPVTAEAVRHDYDEATCVVDGDKHVRTCTVCGEATVTSDVTFWPYDEWYHRSGCEYCQGVDGKRVPHTDHGKGTDNGDGTCSYTCVDCGYIHEGEHPETALIGGDGFHGYQCPVCSTWTWTEDCYEECYGSDGACDDCWNPITAEAVRHDYDEATCVVDGDKHVRTCTVCGEATVTNEVVCWEYDELEHAVGCHYCLRNGEATSERVLHTGMGSGVDNGDGTCSFTCADCGYTYEGEHVVAMGSGNGFHGAGCYYCDTWVWTEECYEDCADQDGRCDECGAPVVRLEHSGDVTRTFEGDYCKHVCSACGATESFELEWVPEESRPSGMTGHFQYCNECGSDTANETPHEYTYKITADTHQGVCSVCEWVTDKEAHTYTDENDLDCDVCGALLDCEHGGATVCTANGDKHDVACARCGEVLKSVELTLAFTATGHYTQCEVCGEASAEEAHTITYTATEDDHTAKCDVCGYVAEAEAHAYANDDDLDCDVCGEVRECDHDCATVCTANGEKHDVACARCGETLKSVELTLAFAATGHYTQCEVCGEASAEEAHTITYAVTNADHTAKCDVCGYAAEAEAHAYESEEANECLVCGKAKQCQHTYWFNIWPAPTCTQSGTRTDYCSLCGKVHSTSTVPAKGHDLSTEDMGDYLLETCSRCDYEVRTEKVSEQPEAPVVTDGLLVNDVDMTAENAVQLPETVTAAKVFTVAYVQDGVAVQPETETTVTLALTEEEMSALEGLKLMLILEDGTMVEVAYEVVDGQIVFAAQQMGTFAFIAD